MLDELAWHIKLVESLSEIEAYYINSLIKYYELKFREKYNIILDIPCGYGRHHKYLRELGYDVYGVDLSQDLINKAKTLHEKYNDKYFVGDMRNFKLNNIEADVIINWFSSFGFFDDDDNLKTLKNFNNNLRKNGLLIIEMPNARRSKERLRSTSLIDYNDYGDYVEITEHTLVDDKYHLFNEKFYKKSGNDLIFEKEIKIKLRLYEIDELVNMLKEAGFKVIEMYDTLTFKKFDLMSSNRVTIISLKNSLLSIGVTLT